MKMGEISRKSHPVMMARCRSIDRGLFIAPKDPGDTERSRKPSNNGKKENEFKGS
jgi:hypothetical protein